MVDKTSTPATLTPADAARGYITQGFCPIPIPPRSKAPGYGWNTLVLTRDEVSQHFRDDSNIGLRLGSASSNLHDVDVDCELALDLAPFFLPPTGMHYGRAGNPGSHYMYFCEASHKGVKYSSPSLGTIIELRGDGGQTVVPPSVHESGEAVRFEAGANGQPAEVLYEPLGDLVRRVAVTTLLRSVWKDGQRHDVTLGFAGLAAKANMPQEICEQIIEAICFVEHDPEREQRLVTIRSTYAKKSGGEVIAGWQLLEGVIPLEDLRKLAEWCGYRGGSDGLDAIQPIPFCSDTSNGLKFARMHAESAMWSEQTKLWMVYDGKRWVEDFRVQVKVLAEETVRALRFQALQAGELVMLQYLAWADSTFNKLRMEAMLAQAKPYLAIVQDELDHDPWLLNLDNGTLHLKTGVASSHLPADRLTRLAGVSHDADAACPKWEAFLTELFGYDPELLDFLPVLAGYLLFGGNPEHKLFLLYGAGANGKSVFLNTLSALLGDYGRTTAVDTLTSKNRDNNQVDSLAKLRGARLVTASETNQGVKFNESLVKAMTGGDAIEARKLYGHSFSFVPDFVPLISTNYKPEIDGMDEGIWRRLVLIPFTYTVPEAKRDVTLGDKLKQELPGILNWALAGLQRYLQQRNEHGQGLLLPRSVQAATKEYRGEMDLIAQFIEDCCCVSSRASVTKGELFLEYDHWCKQQGVASVSQKRLGQLLMQRYGLKEQRTAQSRKWLGIGLLSDAASHLIEFPHAA